MAIALLAIVFGGFARTFFLQPWFETPALPWHLVLHGAALTAWFALLLTQTLLVARGRTPTHRRLGKVALGLAVVLVLTTLQLIRGAEAATAARGITRTQPIAFIVLGDLAALGSFAVLTAYAVVRRERPDLHRRAMLLANIALVTPGLARLVRLPIFDELGGPALFFPALTGAMLAIAAHDWVRDRRVHAITLWASAGILVTFLASGLLARSGAGQAFVAAISLPSG